MKGVVVVKRPDEIHTGDRITYLSGTTAVWDGLCQQGRVVTAPIADPYTAALWFPTRPDDAGEDTEPTWIRHDRVVDVGSAE